MFVETRVDYGASGDLILTCKRILTVLERSLYIYTFVEI